LIEDETLRTPSLKLIQELRAAGFAVEYPLTPAKADKQFLDEFQRRRAEGFVLDQNKNVHVRVEFGSRPRAFKISSNTTSPMPKPSAGRFTLPPLMSLTRLS